MLIKLLGYGPSQGPRPREFDPGWGKIMPILQKSTELWSWMPSVPYFLGVKMPTGYLKEKPTKVSPGCSPFRVWRFSDTCSLMVKSW